MEKLSTQRPSFIFRVILAYAARPVTSALLAMICGFLPLLQNILLGPLGKFLEVVYAGVVEALKGFYLLDIVLIVVYDRAWHGIPQRELAVFGCGICWEFAVL